VLIGIALYMFFKPQLGERDIHPRMRPGPFYALAGLVLGFYDGFIGPGTGTFWTMAFMLGLGFNLTKATGHTKVMNATSNLVSLVCFALAGHVYVAAGVCMGVGWVWANCWAPGSARTWSSRAARNSSGPSS
jgi:uncharacterized membrane protein YfcA